MQSPAFFQCGELLAGDWCESHTISEGKETHLIPIGSEHRHGSAPDQSPAAGCGKRIHTRLVPRDSNASGWNAPAWCCQTRRDKHLRQFSEIREAGHEPQKVHDISSRSVKF